MANYNTTIGRIYATPHSQNCWAWLNAIGAWRKIKPLSADGVTDVHMALTAARDSGKAVDVATDDTDNTIINVYL
jgi:immune inhibitor A